MHRQDCRSCVRRTRGQGPYLKSVRVTSRVEPPWLARLLREWERKATSSDEWIHASWEVSVEIWTWRCLMSEKLSIQRIPISTDAKLSRDLWLLEWRKMVYWVSRLLARLDCHALIPLCPPSQVYKSQWFILPTHFFARTRAAQDFVFVIAYFICMTA